MSSPVQGQRRGFDTGSPARTVSDGHGADLHKGRLGDCPATQGSGVDRPPVRVKRSARCSTSLRINCIARPPPVLRRSCGNSPPRSARPGGARHGTSWPEFLPPSSGGGVLRLPSRGAGQRWNCKADESWSRRRGVRCGHGRPICGCFADRLTPARRITKSATVFR